MKVFFDTEFTGLYKDADLISIGLISEDNKMFYGEINTIKYNKQSEWIKENVLANSVNYGGMQVLDIVDDENDYYVGSKDQIAEYLKVWLAQFDNVELVSDVCHYDMVLFIDLFGTAFDLPKNICPACYDINQDIALVYDMTELEAFNYSRELILARCNKVIDCIKHNSMYDARVIREIYNIFHSKNQNY